MLTQEVVHSVSVTVSKNKDQVFNYIREGKNLSEWLVGTPDVTEISPGEYEASRAEIRYIFIESLPASDPEGQDLVYFDVGAERDRMNRRIMAILSPVAAKENKMPQCHIELIAGRTSDMSDVRWQDVCDRHEAEIHNLKLILDR
ncbi:hypothetical protein [Paremcibacter congregatus]|uniref:hypothetical protein n=1 Tax=Paremcibacter congregatus TaxID=2043170 RepID=UPI0030EBB51E|tara:strand:+ start:4018 stop:4452 length:435 start_codon:yes stop_codon:yes gene_type:complete